MIDLKNTLIKYLLIMLSFCFILAGCSPSVTDTTTSSDIVSSNDNITTFDDSDVLDDEWDESIDDYETDDLEIDDEIYDEIFESAEEGISKIEVSNGSAPVNTDFLGINGIYHAYTYINDKYGRQYTEEQAQMEFDRIAKFGVDNVRTYYNSDYAWDAQTNSWNFESDSMKAVYRWMKEMQKRNITIDLNAAWLLGGMYTKSSFAPWSGIYVEGDEEASIKNYTNWMIESLKQIRAHGINNVKYLIMFTEPASPIETTLTKPVAESRDMDKHIDRWLKVTKALHEALKKEGMRSDYLMVGPNDHKLITNIDGSYMSPFFYHTVKESADYMDIFSSHTYFSHSDETFDFVPVHYDMYLGERIQYVKENTNKRFWIDETDIRVDTDSPWHAMQWSTLLERTMHTGVQNAIIWSLADQQWPNNTTYNNDGFVNGVQKSGILPTLFESSLPRNSFYGTSLLTKYFGNHATVYESYCHEYGFYSAAQIDQNKDWSMFVTNFNVEKSTVCFEFEKNIGKQTFYRHLYEVKENYKTANATIIGVDKIITTSGDRLYDEIPASCIAVYTTVKD